MITITKTKNVLDVNKLNTEVIALNAKIQYVIKIGDDQLRFTLSSPLITAEDVAIDNFLIGFVDQDPEDKIPAMYDIVKMEAKGKHHHNIDYKKEIMSSLIPVRTVIKGEVQNVSWYKELDVSLVPINKIINVDITYTRDTNGFATSRLTSRTWINRDGSNNSEVKTTNKYYFINPADMIVEGTKRRSLLVSYIQIPVLTFMTEALVPLGYTAESVVVKGRAFLDDYESMFSKFVDNSSSVTDPASPDFGLKSIVVKLRDETLVEYVEWLDKSPPSLGGVTTIRQYLMDQFDI